jgi:hypothetical protein
MIDKSLFKIANTPDTQFLLQAELKAIKECLKYEEFKRGGARYKGYVSLDGYREGVGIYINNVGETFTGEWHLD